MYDTLASAWTQWIGVTANSTTVKSGAYSVKYGATSLRVISLNTKSVLTSKYYGLKDDGDRPELPVGLACEGAA